jgi:ABC-type sugar transport system, periplasmic component
MTKKLVAVLLMILMAGVVVGCEFDRTDLIDPAGSGMEWSDSGPMPGISGDVSGFESGEDNPDPNSSRTSGIIPEPIRNKQIVVWADPEDDVVKAAIKKFEEQRPDVKVKLENNSTVDIAAIQRAFSSGQAPDIIRLDHVYITGFGRNGDIINLNDYGAADIAPKFVDSCWQAVSYQGAVYGIPGDANTIGLMYNRDMLNMAGKSANDLATYDGLKATAKAMKVSSPAKTPITFPFFDNADAGRDNWAAFNFMFWLWGEGGEVLSPDYRTATFNRQPGIDAMSKLVSFATDNLTKTRYLETEFYRGEVGMIEMGCWAIPSLINNTNGHSLGVTMMPTLKAGVPGYSGLGLYAWGVTTNKAKTKTPRSKEMNQICFDFLNTFLTNDAFQVSWARKNNFLPTTKTAATNVAFTSNEVWNVFAKQYQITKSRPGITNWLQIEGYISNAINEAVTTKNVPNALNNAAARVNDLLK